MSTTNESAAEAEALLNEMGAVLAKPAMMKLNLGKSFVDRARAVNHAPTRRVAVNAARLLSVAERFEQERRAALAVAPNISIPICVDGLAVNTESGLITVSAPYQGQPWTLCDVIVDGTQVAMSGLGALAAGAQSPWVSQMRISSFKIAGIDFVNQTAAAFASGTPTTPGLSPAIWRADKQHVPENKFRPWAGFALRPEAQILIKVYHEGTATATPNRSLNISLLVRSSPCDQGWNNGMFRPGLQAAAMARLNAFRIPHLAL